ncbi:hypothetical protein HK405_000357, partial [Cladochytrium tenue]
ILADLSVAVAALGLIFTLARIAFQRTLLTWLCLAAAVCITLKSAGVAAYYYVLGQSCQGRYFVAYAFLNSAKMIVYFLYEQRLSMLLQRAKCNPFRWILLALIVIYFGFTIAQIYINLRDCFVTATGSYSVTSNAASICKYFSNALDISISATILLGGFVALALLIAENTKAGIKSSEIYGLIFRSDALRFFLVFPVDVYKMYVSMDASGNTGFFPPGSGNGNNGFLQLLDAYKVTIMIFLLVLPSIVVQVKAASNRSTTSKGLKKSSGHHGTRSGLSSSQNGAVSSN